MSCPIKQFSPEHLESATKCHVKHHCAESDLCHSAMSGHQRQTMHEGGERKVFSKMSKFTAGCWFLLQPPGLIFQAQTVLCYAVIIYVT